jgi:hypothetical protein
MFIVLVPLGREPETMAYDVELSVSIFNKTGIEKCPDRQFLPLDNGWYMTPTGVCSGA